MKKLSIIILTFVILLSCKKSFDLGKSFNITGTLNGNYSDYIYLNYGELKDSVRVKNNKFVFKGSVEKPIQGYLNLKGDSYVAWIYIENSNIKIKTDFKKDTKNKKNINSLKIIEIDGSKSAKILEDYKTFYKNNKSKENFKNLLYNKLKVFLYQNSKHPFSGSILGELALIKPILSKKQLEELFLKIDTTMQNKDDLTMYKMGIENLSKYGIGKSLFNFKLPDLNGHEINLKSYLGTTILIDFWASWCPPCRAKHPLLIKLKDKFNNNDFDIVSVSIDENKENWLKAIKKDNLTWTNLLDNEMRVKEELQITGIPFNYLINENGIITGINLSIEELEKQLSYKFK